MTDSSRTQQELLDENAVLKRRVKELEQAESDRRRVEDKPPGEKRLRDLNQLQGRLLLPNPIGQKLRLITETVVRIVGADFARVWMIKPGDRCEDGCLHAEITEGPHTCRFRDRCLHLMASSGRYTHTDGRDHSRVPFDGYKIGKIASGEESRFLIADVANDPSVHNRLWAQELGLVCFAGYRLVDTDGTSNGVLALFSKQAITAEEVLLIQGIADAASQVLQSARTENELRESEERYRTLVEKATDIVFRTDKDGRISFANPAMIRITGYEKEEMIGKPYTLLVRPDMWAEAGKFFGRQFVKGIQNTYSEFPVLTKDGREIWLGQNTQLVMQEGNVAGFQVVARDITQRKRIEESLRESEEKFRLLIENAPDAIYVHADARFIYLNHAAVELFGIETADQLIGSPLLDRFHPDFHGIIGKRLDDLYRERKKLPIVEQTYLRLDGSSVPVEAHAVPIIYDNRNAALTFVRDITERRRAEQEKAILAEIGKVIGSTLEIEEVYEKFAVETRKLIPFDRLTINLNNPEQRTVTVAYVFGPAVSGRNPGDSFPLSGSVNETLERTRTGMRFHPANVDELTGRYSHLLTTYQAGIRSFMGVPLISRDKVIGVLHFRSMKPDAYSEEHLRLAEMVGAQIAGTIANAQFMDHLERLAKETAIMAEIGKVIGSTLDIKEVYERFAAETQKLIFFDSLTINLLDSERDTLYVAYASGLDIDRRRQGDPLVLEGSLSEAVIRARKSLCIQPADIDESIARYPNLAPIFKAGLRSILCVPLVYRDEVIGVLHFRSKKPDAYTGQDLLLAGRIGEQIVGTIANAQLYAGLRRTEQELKESERRYRELSIIDGLTHLYNSRHFYAQLKNELDRSNRYGQPLTLLLLDLDNFKAFNDAYGHVEGDQVLWRLGQVIKRCLRETDFAFRYGGEEFTILLPMATRAEGVVTAERIRTEFNREIFSPAAGQDVQMTVSIGLAQYRPQEELKAFVHRVDQQMYQGKKNGKDRVCGEP